LNRVDDGKTAVKIGNPKTLEFQVVRTSLLPGLLKTVRENRAHALPIKVFESTDVVLKDASLERQARNVRHAAAIWCNKSAGFEVVHGLLDKVMKTFEVKRISASDTKSESGYYLKEKEGKSIPATWLQYLPRRSITIPDPTYFPGRAAAIYYRPAPSSQKLPGLAGVKESIKSALNPRSDIELGSIGILHPSVLEKFEVQYPCSALEITLEPFKQGTRP
jgi:phenylalanyl-tRNA synthetase beta chain